MNPLPFLPEYRNNTLVLATQQPSAWGNIPTVLSDIIKRFDIKTDSAIEFGVEFGYSTSALANLFNNVIGIDTFIGDDHAGFKGDIFNLTASYLESYSNIKLVKSTYQEFTKTHKERYDLAHVDIIHTYEDTYACGEWCINHANVVIFHDTLSFPDVMKACKDLALKYDLQFYNYEESYGLGILINKNVRQ
jgi:predicted O-methyltransferase YrrM